MLGLAGSLVTALVVSGLAVAMPAAAQTPAKQAPAKQAKQAKPIAEAGNTAAAVQAAVAQKSPVAITDLTTETREVHAQPDGTLKAELSPRAVRTKQGKSWVDVDTTMVRRADGTVGPKVATVELSLSGGGTEAPLVRFGKAGKRISLSWPGALPKPTLEGSIATYAEVLPGVDLAVRAEPDGYVEHLVIKTAAAAKNPALAKIRLGMSTEGVSLKIKPDGGLDATDAKGTVVFTAPPAAMWDAKDTAKAPAPNTAAPKAPATKAPAQKDTKAPAPQEIEDAKDLDTPGAGARRATAKFAVEKQALTVIPDQALLTNPATTFPVVVDPDWHTPGRIGWAKVFSGYPNDEYWNGGGDGGEGKSGLCNFAGCNGIGVAWTYFQYDTGFLAGKRILSASLNTTVTRSPSCNWRNHEAYLTDRQIDGNTNWNNRPGGAAHLDTKNVDVVYSGCDGYKGLGFNVGGWIRGGGISTYLIKAQNEGDSLAWRKFDPNSTNLVVNFNTAPNAPYELSTDGPLPAPCKWCAGKRYYGGEWIRLQTRISDPENDVVRPIWDVYRNGVKETRDWGPSQGSGAFFSTDVDLRGIHDQEIDWYVKGSDGHDDGGYSRGPGPFTVDRVAPDKQPNVKGLVYPEDNRWHGGAGVPDTFTFDSNTVGDINHFEYGWDDATTERVDADALGGKASVTLTPPGDGPRDLFVRSVDRAGHKSPIKQYHFYVRAGTGALVHYPFEGNTKDEAFLGDRDGTLNGNATYVPGAVGSALRPDGQQTTFVSAPTAVRTNTSFSVAAWVKPDLIPAGQVMGVVGQQGNRVQSFYLNARGDNNKWTFTVTSADVDNPSSQWAASPGAPVPGKWTHLAGVYDRPANKVRLYVNGVKVAETALPAGFVPFDATGPVSIGRDKWNGMFGNEWKGALDEVKIYDRILTDGEIKADVSNDNVQVGHWKFDETTGSLAANAVQGGDAGVLAPGAIFGPGAVNGGVKLDGVQGQVTTAGPAVRTNRSFAVGGWVKLDPAADRTQPYTFVSQDGNEVSGFMLQYRPEQNGKWQFLLPGADKTEAQNQEFVFADGNAASDTWTHLAGVYDESAKQIRIYVNGELKGTAARHNGFDAAGSLVVGRGRWQSEARAFWRGSVDEVRAYSRELSVEEIRGIVSQDHVTRGTWKLDANGNDASGRGLTAVPTGTPEWTGGQTTNPDQTDLAVRLNGTDSYLSAPHAVDTDKSFAVAAWAKLDKIGGRPAVVSQDGSRVSAFQLQATPEGRWAFSMFGADDDGGGSVHDKIVGAPAQPGVWTHLVGVYDAAAKQTTIYVNGVKSASGPHAGAWNHAAGGLQIGRAQWDGEKRDYFPGAIDDVSVYSRVLYAEEIKTLAGRDLSLAHNWQLDEPSGTNAADAIGTRNGTLKDGTAFAPGWVGNAVQLDGVDDSVSTPAVDVRTDKSFTVASWVYLDSNDCNLDAPVARCKFDAVTIDGDKTSKFRLGHVVDDDQNRLGAWTFEMPESDAANAQITKAAVSTRPGDLDTWVHLTGVYDAPTKKLWLYVNGTRIGDGTLNTEWQASGGVQIGRGKANGAAAEHWPGRVDDVRIYNGVLDKDRVFTLYKSYPTKGGVPALPVADAGHWKFDENTGTAVADSSGRGNNITLKGGTGWIGGRSGWGAWLDGTSGYGETTGPMLDTSKSFSAAAWVYLTETGTANRVVIGQDGNRVSANYLMYEGSTKKWAAVMAGADQDNPQVTVVHSAEPAKAGAWAHLVMAYDASPNAKQLRLYVNGQLSAAQTGVTGWNATGPLSIGRAKWNGANSAFFPRGIDEVRLYSKALSDGEVRRVHDDTGPVNHGFYRFEDSTTKDYSWRKNAAVSTGGVTFAPGISGQAMQLNGVDGSATAAHIGVVMTDSFTISGWAKLSRDDRTSTVAAQDGTRMSGFVLQYRAGLKRWVFGLPTQDADAASMVYANSLVAPKLNQWTHLTGVYDHGHQQLRLYVDGQLVGTKSNVAMWRANGAFTLGRAKVNGNPAEFFNGAIDEVQTDQWIVSEADIAKRANWPAPAPGQLGRFLNAAGDHYTAPTSEPVREGYHFEGLLGRAVETAHPNTHLLYGCREGTDYFTSKDSACDGKTVVGEIGRVYSQQPTNLATVAMYSCAFGSERADSRSQNCEGAANPGVLLGYTVAYGSLARYAMTYDHWVSAGATRPGYKFEGSLGLLALAEEPGTQQLWSCLDDGDQFVSLDPACEGKTVQSTSGRIWTAAPAGLPSRQLYRCLVGGTQRFVSALANCEGQTLDRPLGYVLTAPPTAAPVFG